MSLIDTITGLFERNARKYMYVPLDFDHVKEASQGAEPLEAGKNYFRLWLSEMCLAKDREWFRGWYPVVHSIIRVQFGTQEINLPYVAGSLNLKDVNSSNLDKVIRLSYPMTALMPFNGGVVEVTAGILAMQGDDYLNRFIKVMGDFSSMLVVPQLSAALNVAGPIAKGVEELFGMSNGNLHLGLHQAYIGKGGGENYLKAGYIAAILAEESELDARELWVVNGRLRYGPSADNSEPLTGRTYMLFRVESREERDDWNALTDIQAPFNEATNALMSGDEERSKAKLMASIAAAMSSPDLTMADRRRVVMVLKNTYQECKKDFEDAFGPTRHMTTRGSPRGGKTREISEVSDLNRAMRQAMPVEKALALGEPNYEEIFGSRGYTRAEPPEKFYNVLTRGEELEELEMPITSCESIEEPAPSPEKAPEEPKTLVRYPNLECPDKVLLGVKFCLSVELLLKSPKPEDIGISIIDIEDKGLQPPEIELVVFSKGFDIEGSNIRVLKVDRDNDSEERFFLIPKELGEQQIRVDFYQYGRRIGTEHYNILVTKELAVNEEVKQLESSWDLPISSEPRWCPPDLDIRVDLDRNDNKTLNFELHTAQQLLVNPSTRQKIGYTHADFGQVSLKVSPEDRIKALYHEMSLMADQPGIDAEQRMAALGNDLWDELIPEKLKQEYWRFRDHVKSMIITSDEPWIQWEMIKPYRYNDTTGEREEDLFWCQRFEMSRWLSGPAPEAELSGGVARPVAPTVVNLNSVRDEVMFIEQLNKLNSCITGLASFSDKVQVLDLMDKGSFTILHFATHGAFDATLPNDSAIQLSGGYLRPSDIQTHFGFLRPRPLIFINACEGAQMGFSFTGLGGWADRLVNKSQVGAFAGAMWEVQDLLALKFTKSFYTSLLQEGKTIAQAFRIAREEVRKADPSNSTWLAYVLYADPEAYMKKSS